MALLPLHAPCLPAWWAHLVSISSMFICFPTSADILLTLCGAPLAPTEAQGPLPLVHLALPIPLSSKGLLSPRASLFLLLPPLFLCLLMKPMLLTWSLLNNVNYFPSHLPQQPLSHLLLRPASCCSDPHTPADLMRFTFEQPIHPKSLALWFCSGICLPKHRPDDTVSSPSDCI